VSTEATSPSSEPIPVYRPSLGERERTALLDAFDSGWISGRGPHIEAFEEAFADTVRCGEAVAVSNGSVALHLVLSVLGIGPGDEVIVPSYTYVACANAVTHAGAQVVLADCSPETLQADLDDVVRRVTDRTRAVIIPFLFGYPLDVQPIVSRLDSLGIALIEDCSEALGTRVGDRPVGNLGLAATYSFFGNKTITTGEGGMVVTSNARLARDLRLFRNQGVGPEGGFAHLVAGFNYRMTNLQAAIGTVQLSRLGEFLERKRVISATYVRGLSGLPLRLIGEPIGSESSYWLCTAILEDGIDREAVISLASMRGIDLRPGFVPMHLLPMYASDAADFPISESIHARVMCLPSYPSMSDQDVASVIDIVSKAVREVAFP